MKQQKRYCDNCGRRVYQVSSFAKFFMFLLGHKNTKLIYDAIEFEGNKLVCYGCDDKGYKPNYIEIKVKSKGE